MLRVSIGILFILYTAPALMGGPSAWAHFGAVHLLCNNAGVAEYGPVWEVSPARWRRVLGVNLWGTIHGCLAFVPRMLKQRGAAHILNTASMAGLVTPPGAGAYGVRSRRLPSPRVKELMNWNSTWATSGAPWPAWMAVRSFW